MWMAEPAPRPQLQLVGAAKPSSDELVDAIEQGDARVSGALYDHLFPMIDRAIVKVCGSRESDHDDLIQSTFEQIVASIARGRFRRDSSLGTWASAIACHVALNAIRRRRRERRVIDRRAEVDDDRHGATSGRAEARVDLDRVRVCLSELTEEKAEALVLHDVLGHDLTEIAAMTGVSVAAAQTRLSRGRRELVERMTKGRTP
jgi:RNA polymerase sigma-70 factor, ECF subfamily